MPDITAKINVNTSAGPKKVSVTLPSAQAAGNTATASFNLGSIYPQTAKCAAKLCEIMTNYISTIDGQVHTDGKNVSTLRCC